MNLLREFTECVPNSDFMAQVFKFDVRNLEHASDLFISQSVIALSQYLVYFKYNYNQTRADLLEQQKLLEGSIFELMTDDIVKKYKTKKDATLWMINNMAPLASINTNIDVLQKEIYLLDGIDKQISEIVAAFKRELTRREYELHKRR